MSDTVHDLTGFICEGTTRVGKFNLPRGSVEQSYSQFLLEFADLPGEWGLANLVNSSEARIVAREAH
jgi:hypothetical protein